MLYPDGISEFIYTMNTSLQEGLTSKEVVRRLQEYGTNALTPLEPPRSIFRLILDQFDDRLSQLLVGVAMLSAVMAMTERDSHGALEPIVITLVLFINAVIGSLQSLTAEKAMSAVNNMQPREILCTRDGNQYVAVNVTDLVPGDVVHLQAGDVVPCDIRVMGLSGGLILGVDESSLTGESVIVYKKPEDSADTRTGMIFAGTEVKLGKGIGVVVSTGDNTELGIINKQIAIAKSRKSSSKTPLTKQLNRFGDQLSIGVLVICLVLWLSNINNFSGTMFPSVAAGAIYYLKMAVALGIAAVPEGLPSAITLCLSVGAKRMASRNVLIRKLAAVETLGSCSVICTDKTGTLTTNKMVVEKVLTVSKNKQMDSIGSEVSTDISVLADCHHYLIVEDSPKGRQSSTLDDIAAVCHASSMTKKLTSPHDCSFDKRYSLSGEATDVALVKFADEIECRPVKWRKLISFDFDPIRKSSSVLVEVDRDSESVNDSDKELFVKGAAEMLLDRCKFIQLDSQQSESLGKNKAPRIVPLTSEIRVKILLSIKNLSSRGTIYEGGEQNRPMRCIAIAKKNWPIDETYTNVTDYKLAETDLTFLGVCGIMDPPRPESKEAIMQCMQAGIRVIMITGDSADTAAAVGRQVNLITDSDAMDAVISTPDFMALDMNSQINILKRKQNLVFYRAKPLDKLHLVTLLKEKCGDVVAMTGDGVNDAPALHKADVGVAMGITGTEVSKSAADIVLSDDNFMSIVRAVAEGRNIYGNMKRCVHFLVSCNIAEIMIVAFAMLRGFPDILQPLHVLWINAITDGLPALAMGMRGYDVNVLNERPRDPKAPIIDTYTFIRHIATGMYMAIAATKVFSYWYNSKDVSDFSLSSWSHCHSWPRFTHSFFAPDLPSEPCDIFSGNLKSVPQTMVLASIVSMELFKALGTVLSGDQIISIDRKSFLDSISRSRSLILTVVASFLVNWLLIQVYMYIYVYTFPRIGNEIFIASSVSHGW